jgi:hypothetical protein
MTAVVGSLYIERCRASALAEGPSAALKGKVAGRIHSQTKPM